MYTSAGAVELAACYLQPEVGDSSHMQAQRQGGLQQGHGVTVTKFLPGCFTTECLQPYCML